MEFHHLFAAALIAAGSLLSGPAHAQAAWFNYGVLHKHTSHQCITTQGEARPGVDAVPLGLQACALETVDGRQAWGWIPVERKGTRKGVDVYAFQNVLSQACIGVEGGSRANGARLVATRCNFEEPAQLWLRSSQLRPATAQAGMSKWVNLKTRKCITVEEQNPLRQAPCQWNGAYWPQEFTVP